ncbi:MAG: lipopolysaccharide core biosynthesis protein rfaS [Pedobacter sp.]|nr:MAG: lipopolysaccharide core biosynthesis protein rfaS [Pedobacter sp.]
MKQILLMMPSYYHFDEVIKDGLTKYSQYDVVSVDTSYSVSYKNFLNRGVNFLSKVFLKKNLKPEMRRKYRLYQINRSQEYEYLIVNRPDLIEKDVFELALKKSKKSLLLLWDSLDKLPADKEIIKKFDVVYSFDLEDCKKYGFRKIENFHFFESLPIHTVKYDAVFFGTLDSRIDDLKHLLEYLGKKNKKAHAYLNIPWGKKFQKYPRIETLNKIIPYKKSYMYAMAGDTIIDLGHKNQNGLSFRFYEAMSFSKKIITTNAKVAQYDFYNEKNIFIIGKYNLHRI